MAAQAWTWTAMKAANKAAGRFYWSRGSVKCFRSRNEGRPYSGPGGVFAVVSRQFVGSDGTAEPRQFSVIQFAAETGEVRGIGQCETRAEALAYARARAAGEVRA